MKRFIGFASLVALLFVVSGYAQTCNTVTNSDDSVFQTKAQELTQDKVSRLDKLQALHTFVRDEIAQARTQYG